MSVPATPQTTCPCVSLCRTVGKIGAIVLPLTAAVLAVLVLAPWRSLDAAAPPAADDPFSQGSVVYPVPAAFSPRGQHSNDNDDAVMLDNWHYTYIHEGF